MLARTIPSRDRVVVVGAGIGGLVSALLLAHAGFAVTVVEKESKPGGKLREIEVAGRMVDSGPTVLTMRHVFDRILGAVGERLDDHLTLAASPLIARHHWPDGSCLDLHSDIDRSAQAIAAFAGEREAQGYRAYAATTAKVHATLEAPFIEAVQPSIPGMMRAAGIGGIPSLMRIRAFSTLAAVIGEHFRDPRLRQLFGRYATYCGSSPYEAPGPLMLIAHVEQAGVWIVEEGMHSIARLLERLAMARGAEFLYETTVAHLDCDRNRLSGITMQDGKGISCDAVVFNGDPAALSAGLLGDPASHAAKPYERRDRSLSAVTLSIVADAGGFPLAHHNVFFSADYEAEFAAIRAGGNMPVDPTVYLCAPDRGVSAETGRRGPEPLFTIVNAPADGDIAGSHPEDETCIRTTLDKLARSGLTLTPQATVVTTPQDFETHFPGTGGALYGRASHGWAASFQRPISRTPIAGLYLAGGAVHPGPGLPMAALSGRNAAQAIIRDRGSTASSSPAAMPGGMSMR